MNYISANQVAFVFSTGFSASTIYFCMKVAETATKTNTFAFGFLALLSGVSSFSAITAWTVTRRNNSNSSKDYFENFASHVVHGLPIAMEVVSKTIFKAVGEGFYQGIRDAVREKLASWSRSDSHHRRPHQ